MGAITIDFEVASEADVTVVGAVAHACHPSTRPLCIAITNEDSKVIVYDLTIGQWPKEWEIAVLNGWDIRGWNVLYEHAIVTYCLKHWPQPKQWQWQDVQFQALTQGYPAKLSVCAKALGLEEQKDTKGTHLINYWCKPHNGELRQPSDNPERWAELLAYCRQDVVTTCAIHDALPDLTSHLRDFWDTTFDQNIRGIAVDLTLVRNLKDFAERAKAELGATCEAETSFPSSHLGNHRAVLGYVQGQGVDTASVAKASVVAMLAHDLPDGARSVLEARQALGKTSVSKLDTILRQVGPDDRLYGLTRACGSATGRDSSLGAQIQNIPRGSKVDTEELIDAARCGAYDAFAISAKHGVLDGVVSCLRGCFVAGPGRVLTQCDFSAIEPRIGAWVVGDHGMLSEFRHIDANGGVDIYQIEAARFFNMEPANIKGDMRQFGKVYVLQNQYGSGEGSIQRSAKDQYRLNLTLEDAKACKDHWRSHHGLWVSFWYDLQDGAFKAIRNQGTVYRVGPVAWCYNGLNLRLRLPSGRIINFAQPAIVTGDTGRDCLEYAFAMESGRAWIRGTTTPGSLFNVVVQGTGACLMMASATRLRKEGYHTVLRAHDELVAEVIDTPEHHATFQRLMLKQPVWAAGLPINGAGWTGPRFKKD